MFYGGNGGRDRRPEVFLADFLAKKGQLYNALRVINNAGQEVYAHDLNAAARFNTPILHRRFTTPIEDTATPTTNSATLAAK